MLHNAYWEIIFYGPWPHCLQYSRWLKYASEASGPQKTKKRLGGNFEFSGCGIGVLLEIKLSDYRVKTGPG